MGRAAIIALPPLIVSFIAWVFAGLGVFIVTYEEYATPNAYAQVGLCIGAGLVITFLLCLPAVMLTSRAIGFRHWNPTSTVQMTVALVAGLWGTVVMSIGFIEQERTRLESWVGNAVFFIAVGIPLALLFWLRLQVRDTGTPPAPPAAELHRF